MGMNTKSQLFEGISSNCANVKQTLNYLSCVFTVEKKVD